MTNILKLMQAAKKMEKSVKETDEKLRNTQVTGSAGPNNCVSIETNGQHICTKVELGPETKNLSNDELAQAILNAINQTNEKIKELSKTEFSQIADLIASETKDS